MTSGQAAAAPTTTVSRPRLVRWWREGVFSRVPNDWQTYQGIVGRHLRPGMRVLEVGCGKGVISSFPWERFPEVSLTGIDPDPAAATNPNLHDFIHMADPASWNVEAASYDLVLARYVLEHVDDPEAFMGNVGRALRPGGRFIFLTPNFHHPAMRISDVLPHAVSTRILRRTNGLDETDVFPTRYRCNTVGRLRALADDAGMEPEVLAAAEYQPVVYLDFNSLTFVSALAYYAVVRGIRPLDRRFGASIIGVFRRT